MRRDVVPSLFEVWIDDDVIVRSPELDMTRLSRGSGSLLIAGGLWLALTRT